MVLLLVVSSFALPVSHPASHLTLSRVVQAAATEQGVPAELLYAIGYEASGMRPHAEPSAWGGRTLYDFVEADAIGGPDLEQAAALIEADPNAVIADWKLATRAAAALLAQQARANNGGVLPPVSNLDAWQPAVAAFSGRDEPMLQGLYVQGIYELLEAGFVVESPLGRAAVAPQAVTITRAAPPPGSTDYSGAAHWVPACTANYSDYSRGAGDIDLVIMHTVQGSYSGCISWFQNCSAQVSAHYVVRSSDGEVTQMLHEEDVGWHAGNWEYNERSVGIEHEGYVSDCGYYTEAMYRSSAALTADIAARQGVPLDRSHIIGHNEVPGATHTDPGSCWDWDYFMGLVTGGGGEATGEVLGYVRADDIYNTGGNLVGAAVWIAETGATTTVDGEGMYRFSGLPYGTYTVHASTSGYAEGTCTSELGGAQDWCSIALFPGGDDTGTATDTAETDDSGGNGNDDKGPGSPTTMSEAGCGCNSAGAPLGGLAAALVLSLRRRRARS